jgi:hypothetical protein
MMVNVRAAMFVTALVAAGAGVAGQGGLVGPPASWTTPRTPWGHPDLQGIYSNDDETGTPMERPAQLEGKTHADLTPAELEKIVKDRNERFVAGAQSEEFAGGLSPPVHLIFDTFERKNKRAWLVVDPPDGKIPPMTEAARSRPRVAGGVSTNANPKGPFNSWLDMGLYDRCITRGIPASMMPAGYGSRYEIWQSPDSVAIRYEMIHETRVIPFDGRPHITPSLRQHLGDARARWEGETLVVETINFRADTAPQRGSDRVRMIERFRAVSGDVVEWSVTFDDPTTWTRPWTFMMPLSKVDHTQQVHEYACHEGNHAMRNILSAARAEEATPRETAGTPARK